MHLMEQAWGATVAFGGGSRKLGGGRSSAVDVNDDAVRGRISN